MSINRALRILHLEDEPDFSDLVCSLLEKEGIKTEITLVSTRHDFEKALNNEEFDLVLADYSLPSYNGLEALSFARKNYPQKPFLLISGTIGDQAAIESLKAGATDYVLKMLPERLVPAIRRAAEEAEERRQRRRVETELVRREKYFRSLTENALDIVTVLSKEGVYLYNSPSVQRVLGYDPKSLVGKLPFDFVHPEDVGRVREGFETGLKHPERTITLEFRFLHHDGSWRYLEAVGQNRLAEPEIAAVVVNSRDITDRKQAEESLRESEKQYRLIFDGNPTPMWIFDQETLAFLEANDAALRHYGYSRNEFLAMNIAELRPPEEVPAMIEYLHKLVAAGRIATTGLVGVWCHQRKDGTHLDVEIKWNPVLFKGRAACLAMANDVTEKKRIEHRDTAFSKLGQSLSSATTPGEAAEIIRGIASDLFRWDAFTLDLYSEERDLVFPILNIDTDKEGRRFNVPVNGRGLQPSGMAKRIIRDGAELTLREEPLVMPNDVVPMGDASRPSASLLLVPIRNRTKVIGVLSIQSYSLKAYDQQDLSTLQALADYCGGALERIHAEQALHLSEMRFHDLFEGSPDAIFVETFDGKVLDVNPAACQLHGTTKDDLIGKTVLDLVPVESREEVARDFALLAEGKLHQIEGISLTKDGRAVPVDVRANRIEYGGASALLLHVRDVSERKQAEAALRSSEMLFHSVWENSVDGMRLTDEEGCIIAVNEAFCKLVGMPRERLEGNRLTVIYADSEQPQTILQNYQQRFIERVIEKPTERRLTLRDGKVVTLEETSLFVELRGQPSLLLGLFRDVTAQKRLEEQLRQSQKMEAIGQLAGGVAHDFNNILTVIQGHASLLMTSGGLAGVAARSAQQIGQAAERASGLTRQLLTFGRRQFMQLKCLDMNEVVGNMTKMLSRLLGEHIALQINYFPEPAPVQADASMMEQVLLNLAVNARDAMPKGGQLLIKIEIVDLDALQVMQHHEAHPGRHVRISAIDKGCGIAPENLRRIFEPFFTTKEVGKGTGLGLATVYGIVKQHQGWVEVESELGKGTTFRVHLPCSTQFIRPAEPNSHHREIRGGNETILVVEDEAPVRELVCDLLAGHGYQILQAESGRKALDVWNHSKDRIDLVLTDLVMPDRMNGRELAERLWGERPDLKIIFTSGYSADVVGKDFVTRHALNYLQKPYHPQRLATVVRDCLDAVN